MKLDTENADFCQGRTPQFIISSGTSYVSACRCRFGVPLHEALNGWALAYTIPCTSLVRHDGCVRRGGNIFQFRDLICAYDMPPALAVVVIVRPLGVPRQLTALADIV